MAQDSWKVYCGTKVLLKTSVSDASKNTVILGGRELASGAELKIVYKDRDPQKDWTRIIAVFDDNDNELERKETDSFSLRMSKIRELSAQYKKLTFYTWALPKDPELAARIRIRRVYLCTVEMK